MCGLFGVVRFSGLSDGDSDAFKALSESLRHRGPDGTGLMESPTALLGMHRLSIMDVSHGWQPFWTESESIGVLGNGEIYNARELRAMLVDRGHRLATGSDIEVVPHLYEEFGEGAYAYLRGMFALVILDRQTSTLTLVRDRMGEKPLSYFISDEALYFASEQSPLVRSGLVPLDIDESVLPDYLLHGFVPEPRSLIRGIRKLPAGHFLEIDLETGDTRLAPYWNMLDALSDEPLTTAGLADSVRDAVEACCESDVPVGIALSGGLDSSLVAALAARVRPDLQAFSIGYHGTETDESSLAQSLATSLGIPCHVTHLDSKEVGAHFSEICAARDEPISDIAGPALAAVSLAARQAGVPVLLTGMGGDELFWGYDWVRRMAAFVDGQVNPGGAGTASLDPRIPAASAAGIARWLDSRGGLRAERDVKAYLQRWSEQGRTPAPLYEFQPGYGTINAAIRDLCSIEGTFPSPEAYLTTGPSQVPGDYTQLISATYLRVNGLAQLDRLSMHHSIEARTPLVDYRLVERVMSSRASSDGGVSQQGKADLRRVAESVLPADVINRPKRGFTPPVRTWIREIWSSNAQALMEGSILAASGLVKPDRLRAELARPIYRSGRVNQMALRLATLELWLASLRP
jgi:asparagine synthase (glutamine-hydrolysing)